MKKLLLLTFNFLFFYCGNSYSADCGDATVVDCALTSSDDEIVMSDGGTVTVTSSGSIIAVDTTDGEIIQLPASTSNFTLTNSGTITGAGTLSKSSTGANQRAAIELTNQGSGISGGENATITLPIIFYYDTYISIKNI